MLSDWWLLAVAAIVTGALMPVAIRARSLGHDPVQGVQKLHAVPTSRLGGAVIFVAFGLVAGFAQLRGFASMGVAWLLALAALPVVAMGAWEDITRSVRPRYRLLAAIVSAAIASLAVGGIVPRVDIGAIDRLLGIVWIALPLTWFMVAGACNAVNLIDGVHGLAGGTTFIMFGGIALMAGLHGDAATLAPALAMMGALAGFLFWNYPRGRVFLGDAGAYFVGFMYAELSIQLVAHNDALSAWYVIMLAGYPIVDTLVAMYRRGWVRRRPLMTPDALHLHSLVFRRVTLPLERWRQAHATPSPPRRGVRLSDEHRLRANGRVAPRVWLHSLICFALAVAFHDNTPALWFGLIVYAAFYMNRYRTLVRFRRKAPRRAERVIPPDTDLVNPKP